MPKQTIVCYRSLWQRIPLWQIQYIPRNMHTDFALLCFVLVIHWLTFPYPSGLLHWHCGNLTIAPVPAKQPWWIRINTSCEFIMNDCITTTKQSTTKPCAYFVGYTLISSRAVWQCRLWTMGKLEKEKKGYRFSTSKLCDNYLKLYVFEVSKGHYNYVIMSAIVSRITGPPLFAQLLVQAQIKENFEATRHWPLCGEFTGDRCNPRTGGQ